jgi:hypothetical protein
MSENNTSVTSEYDVGAAAKARPGGAMLTVYRWALLVFLAAGVVQIFLAIFGALHATDGLLILAIPAYLYVWTGRRAA